MPPTAALGDSRVGGMAPSHNQWPIAPPIVGAGHARDRSLGSGRVGGMAPSYLGRRIAGTGDSTGLPEGICRHPGEGPLASGSGRCSVLQPSQPSE